MKYIIGIVGIGILLLAAGCATSGNLPPRGHFVGGGLQIDWDPPRDGTAILFERTTGKTVATMSVNPGNPFRFDVTRQSHAEVLEAVFGDSPPPAWDFLLYFIPSSGKP